MIVTRSWLQEYIDISDIDNDTLNKRFNEIGLEVDSIVEHIIPKGVVVGEVKSCEKHPDADKLNVCQVDVGSEVVQIVCGAKNVVNAKYVAVATVGSVLPGNFKIKKAKLRGVESLGMICSSTELGLPELEDGIMILDDSIGELVVGKELNEYPKFADTTIELELTANRGDCTNIHGVARDLAAAFNKDIKPIEFEPKKRSIIGVAKELNINLKVDEKLLLDYSICSVENLTSNFLNRLRLAFVGIDVKEDIDILTRYATHSFGSLCRAYDFNKISEDNRVNIEIVKKDNGAIAVVSNNRELSLVGISQNKEFKANSNSTKILLETSYIEPDLVVDIVSSNKLESDELYYNSSRGSEPRVVDGIKVLQKTIYQSGSNIEFSSGEVAVGNQIEARRIAIDIYKLTAIIGNPIPTKEIITILSSLGFELTKIDDNSYVAEIPLHAHDIKNLQDIAEEVMRIYGIDNITSIHSTIVEKNRITPTKLKYDKLRDLRNKAVGAGFFEALTYIFANKDLLQKYNCEVLDEKLELLNPIVKELNTLRTTIVLNLLEAASQNAKYGKKTIALFEEGIVYNHQREEKEVITFLFSGEEERASILNSAKAKIVDITSFTKRLGSIIGEFKLRGKEPINNLAHPYICASIIKDNKEVGYLAKLHPSVAKDFNLKDTFFAELNLDDILPKHINAKPLSNYQAVNKDLSIVIDEKLNFYNIAKELQELKKEEELIKDFYPLDLYSDDSLGDKKSLTIRFTIQSDKDTLSDKEIEEVMQKILNLLKEKFGAELR